VLADKETSDSGRCHFCNVQWDHRYKHGCGNVLARLECADSHDFIHPILTSSKSSDSASSDEHANMHGACLESASDDVDDRGKDYKAKKRHVSKKPHQIGLFDQDV
jgi:hypothetical protein